MTEAASGEELAKRVKVAGVDHLLDGVDGVLGHKHALQRAVPNRPHGAHVAGVNRRACGLDCLLVGDLLEPARRVNGAVVRHPGMSGSGVSQSTWPGWMSRRWFIEPRFGYAQSRSATTASTSPGSTVYVTGSPSGCVFLRDIPGHPAPVLIFTRSV